MINLDSFKKIPVFTPLKCATDKFMIQRECWRIWNTNFIPGLKKNSKWQTDRFTVQELPKDHGTYLTTAQPVARFWLNPKKIAQSWNQMWRSQSSQICEQGNVATLASIVQGSQRVRGADSASFRAAS